MNLLWIICLTPLIPDSVHAGAALEEYLNCIQLDQYTPELDEKQHGTIEPDLPLGQTFNSGKEVETVFRIELWQAFWNETWQPDESLVMTLWDSPLKKTAYGRYAIPYDRRMWEGALPMFTVNARVAPEHSYYFELTVEIAPLRPAEIPREWILEKKRPGFAHGDGKIAGIGRSREDYTKGQAYIGGIPQDFDLWFEVHVRKIANRDALYTHAFDRFDLEAKGLERVRAAVKAKDWDRACDELIKHFESRKELFPEKTPAALDSAFDTREADLAAEHRVLLEDGTTVDLGPEWNHFTLWPERGGVGLTRTGLRKHLAAGYAHTGNEKYARAWNDMLYHLFIHCPSPLSAGLYTNTNTINAAMPHGLAGGSMWSGLSIGARLGHGFFYYAPFLNSQFFTRDMRAAFIFNLAEMAEVLDRQRGGGNWETQMANGLMDVGIDYPEFKGAGNRIKQGFEMLIDNAKSTVRPDGVLQEPTTGYHGMVMRRYAKVMKQSKELGLTVPEEMATLTEKMYELHMYGALPDGTLPPWGDTFPPIHPDDLIQDATFFNRPDFLYVGTQGKAGHPPARTSYGFPHGGFFYMRNSWKRDSHYLGIHCGPHGSHGHLDALSIIASSFGRLILIDPGVYTYGTPETQELTATRSHNTLTVDDQDAEGGEMDLWIPSKRFDFFAGHNTGYRGLRNVQHYRRIWFLKPEGAFNGLWLIRDDVIGGGEHEVQARFRFALLPVQEDSANHRIWTTGMGGNLLLQGLGAPGLSLKLNNGIACDPQGGGLIETPLVTWRRKGSLPAVFLTVLVPYQGDHPPHCNIKSLVMTDEKPDTAACWIEMGDEAFAFMMDGLISMTQVPASHEIALPDGRILQSRSSSMVMQFKREKENWIPASVFGVRIQKAVLAGNSLIESQEVRESFERSLLDSVNN